jgi:hypothetical protein
MKNKKENGICTAMMQIELKYRTTVLSMTKQTLTPSYTLVLNLIKLHAKIISKLIF